MKPLPNCTECGACCWVPYERDDYCDLTEKEYKRFSPQFRAKNVKVYGAFSMLCRGAPPAALRTRWKKQTSGPFKGSELFVCCMLDGSVLHRVRCRIYETRPRVCRKAVKPGSRACLAIRSELLVPSVFLKHERGQT